MLVGAYRAGDLPGDVALEAAEHLEFRPTLAAVAFAVAGCPGAVAESDDDGDPEKLSRVVDRAVTTPACLSASPSQPHTEARHVPVARLRNPALF